MHRPQFISTQAYAEQAGISPSTVTKWLRSGKLKGCKEGGKWLVSTDQQPGQTAAVSNPAATLPPNTVPAASPPAEMAYSVEEFSALTYLTAFGVQTWLKAGRLSGTMDTSGRWRVDAANLQDPKFQRLVRK